MSSPLAIVPFSSSLKVGWDAEAPPSHSPPTHSQDGNRDQSRFHASRNTIYSVGSCAEGQLGRKYIGSLWSGSPIQVDWSINDQIVQLACGEKSSFAVTQSGDLFAWGDGKCAQLGMGERGTLIIPTLIAQNVAQVNSCNNRTFAVRVDGTLLAWGQGKHGLTGFANEEDLIYPRIMRFIGAGNVSIRNVACGFNHTFCTTAHGRLFGWGQNVQNCIEPPFLTEAGYVSTQMIRLPKLVEIKDPDVSNEPLSIQSVACGRSHTLVLTENGLVYGFGANTCGQVGVGDMAAYADDSQSANDFRIKVSHPQRIYFGDEQDAVRKVSKISAAHLHSAALLDFDLYMWGCGTSGQLGIPDKLYVHAPTKVATEGPVHTVACSDRFTCYMLRSGAVVTMGSVCPARELDGEIDINGEPILLESAWKVKKIFQLPNFDSQTFLGSNACLAVGNSHIIFTSGAYESKSQSLLSRFNSLSSRESGYYTLECRLMRRLMGNTPATSSQGAIAGPRRRRSISGDESTNIVHTEEDMLTIEDIRLILFHKDCRLNDLMTEMCRAYKKRVIFRSVHAQGNLTQRIHKLIGDRMCLSSDSIIREEIMPVPRRTLQTSLILRVSVAGSIAENVANEAQNLTQNTRDREEMVQLVKLSSENKRFQGHDRPITCITSDDVYLFTASEDGIIRGWRKKMSNFTFAHPCEKVFEGHSDQVTGIVVVQVDVQEAEGFPGRLLCSASCDNTLRIWDVQLEETIDVVEHQSRVLQIVYSDLGILYTGCEDGSVYVYDFRNPRSRRVLSHTSPSAISAMTCDDNFLYCGRVDGNLVAYQTSNIRNPQLSTSAEVFVKEDRHDDRAHQAAVSCLFESTDYLFSGGHDNCVNIWKKGSRQLVKVVGGSFQHERLVTSITYVPDKCMLITSSWDGTVRLRSLEFLGNSVRINSLTHVIRDHLSTSDFDTFRPLGFAKYVGGWLLVSSDEPMSKELQQATQASKMSVYKTIAFDLRGWSPKDDNPVNNLLRYRMAGHQDMITCVHIDNNDVYTGGKDGNAIRFQADLNSEYIQPRTVRQDQLYSSFIRRVKFQHLPWILNYLSVVMILFDLFNMLGLPLRRKDSIESKSQFFRAILQSFEIDFENGNLRTSFFIILAFGLVTSLLVVDKLTFQATRYEYAVKIRNYTFILSAVATIYANVVGGIVYFSIIGKLYPDSLPKAKLGSIIDELSPGTIPRLLLFLLVILFALCCLRLHVLNCSIDRVNYLDLDRRLRSFGREMDWKHRIKTFFTHSDDLPEIRNHFLFSKQDYTWDKLYVLVKMCFIVVTSHAVKVKIIAPILLAFVSFMFVLLFKRPPFYSIYAMTVRAVVLVDLCVSYIFLIFNNEDYTYGRYDIMPLFVILIGVSFVSTFIILRYLNAKQTKTLVVDQPDHRQQSLILIQETFPVAPQPPRMSFSTQMLLPRQFSIRSNH